MGNAFYLKRSTALARKHNLESHRTVETDDDSMVFHFCVPIAGNLRRTAVIVEDLTAMIARVYFGHEDNLPGY